MLAQDRYVIFYSKVSGKYVVILNSEIVKYMVGGTKYLKKIVVVVKMLLVVVVVINPCVARIH